MSLKTATIWANVSSEWKELIAANYPAMLRTLHHTAPAPAAPTKTASKKATKVQMVYPLRRTQA
jgi:hypothetical protein